MYSDWSIVLLTSVVIGEANYFSFDSLILNGRPFHCIALILSYCFVFCNRVCFLWEIHFIFMQTYFIVWLLQHGRRERTLYLQAACGEEGAGRVNRYLDLLLTYHDTLLFFTAVINRCKGSSDSFHR